MPANGRWDLIRRLKVKTSLKTGVYKITESLGKVRQNCDNAAGWPMDC